MEDLFFVPRVYQVPSLEVISVSKVYQVPVYGRPPRMSTRGMRRSLVRRFRRSDAPIIDRLVFEGKYHGVTVNTARIFGPLRGVGRLVMAGNARVRRGFARMRDQIHFLYAGGRIQWLLWNMVLFLRFRARLQILEDRERVHFDRYECEMSRCYLYLVGRLRERLLHYVSDVHYDCFRRLGFVGLFDDMGCESWMDTWNLLGSPTQRDARDSKLIYDCQYELGFYESMRDHAVICSK
jgi:hypothetical protein